MLNRDEAKEKLDQKIQAVSLSLNNNSLETKIELQSTQLHGLNAPLELSRQTAHKILSLDDKGEVKKQNLEGNNVVVNVGHIWHKQGYDLEGIRPVHEEAAYQMSHILGGNILAPTRLLRIDMLNKKYFVQASLDAACLSEGAISLSLYNILNVHNGIKELKKLPEETRLADILFTFIDRRYITDFRSRNNIPESDRFNFMLDEFRRRPTSEQPKEIRENEKPQNIQIILGNENPLDLLALTEKISEFSNKSFKDLLNFIHLFESLKTLYFPNNIVVRDRLADVISHSSDILSHFDSKNIFKHILLELLSFPSDHDSNNYRVLIKHDAYAQLLPLEIIAIDNDKALEGAFFTKNGNTYPKVITVLFCISQILNIKIENEFKKDICSIQPEIATLNWLETIEAYTNHIRLLVGDSRELKIDDDTQLISSGRQLREQLRKIQKVLREDKSDTLSLGGLISQIEPAIYEHYKYYTSYHYDDPIKAILDVRKQDRPIQEDKIERKNEIATISNFTDAIFSIKQLEIIISVSEFMEMNESTITQLKQFKTAKIILSTNNFIILSLDNPLIFSQLINSDIDIIIGPALIKKLIKYKFCSCLNRDQDGKTLLHHAANRSVIKHYLPVSNEAGIPLESTDKNNQTALDIAICQNDLESCKQLICAGAGAKLLPTNGLRFIARYLKAEVQICQMLLTINQDIGWEFGINEISQREIVSNGSEITCFNETRYLKENYMNNLYPKNKEPFPRDNKYGRTDITILKWESKDGLYGGFHLKEINRDKDNIELISHELIVNTLARCIWGTITPTLVPFKFTRRLRDEYNRLVLCSVNGQELFDFLNNPDLQKQIDKKSLSQAILLAMLINPGDGRGDNYILYPVPSESHENISYQIRTIDNEASFVQPILLDANGREIPGRNGLQLITVLFCMDYMLEHIEQGVVTTFLQLNTMEIIENWLRRLDPEYKKIDSILNIDAQFPKFRPSIIIQIYEKIENIKNVIQKFRRNNEEITHLELLKRVMPSVGRIYSDSFEKFPDTNDRFYYLTKGKFEEKIIHLPIKNIIQEIYFGSKLLPSQMFALTRDQLHQQQNLHEEKRLNLIQAISHLNNINLDFEKLRRIRNLVDQGSIAEFKVALNNLQISDHCEKVINGWAEIIPVIDFERMSSATNQESMLAIIEQSTIQKLKLICCPILTDKRLEKILINLPRLQVLELDRCLLLTNSIIEIIGSHCAVLEKLILKGLNLTTITKGNFPALRTLIIENCNALATWNTNTPRLEKLDIRSAPILATIETNSIAIKNLFLSGLAISGLINITKLSLYIDKIIIINCNEIPENRLQFAYKYPFLLSLPLEEDEDTSNNYASEYITLIDSSIGKVLLELKMKASSLSRVQKSRLYNGLASLKLKKLVQRSLINSLKFKGISKTSILSVLEKLSQRDRLINKILIEHLEHKDEESAAFVLGWLNQTYNQDCVKPFLKALNAEHNNKHTIRDIILALGKLEHSNEDVNQSLLKFIEKPSYCCRPAAISLARLNHSSAKINGILISALQCDISDYIRMSSAQALVKLGRVSLILTQFLCGELVKNHIFFATRDFLMTSFTMLYQRNARVIDTLFKILDENTSSEALKQAAIDVILYLSQQNTFNVEDILRFSTDKNITIRLAVTRALGFIQHPDESVITYFKNALNDRIYEIRLEAARSLGSEINNSRDDVVTCLINAANTIDKEVDEPPFNNELNYSKMKKVKQFIIDCLSSTKGEHYNRSIPIFTHGLKDTDHGVKNASAKALRKARGIPPEIFTEALVQEARLRITPNRDAFDTVLQTVIVLEYNDNTVIHTLFKIFPTNNDFIKISIINALMQLKISAQILIDHFESFFSNTNEHWKVKVILVKALIKLERTNDHIFKRFFSAMYVIESKNFINSMDDSQNQITNDAVNVLTLLLLKNRGLLADVFNLLHNSSNWIKKVIIKALALSNSEKEPIIKECIKLLHVRLDSNINPFIYVKECAIHALSRLDLNHEDVIINLLIALYNEPIYLKKIIIHSFSSISLLDKSIVIANLSLNLKSADWSVRFAIITTMIKLGKINFKIRDIIKASLKVGLPLEIRKKGINYLIQLNDSDFAVNILLKLLDDEDPDFKIAAIQALAKFIESYTPMIENVINKLLHLLLFDLDNDENVNSNYGNIKEVIIHALYRFCRIIPAQITSIVKSCIIQTPQNLRLSVSSRDAVTSLNSHALFSTPHLRNMQINQNFQNVMPRFN